MEVEAVLVKAQNVHDYAEKHMEANGWDDLKNFACSRPPFTRMIFSYDNQGKILVHFDVSLIELDPEKLTDIFSRELSDKVGAGQSIALIQRMNPYRILSLTFYAEGRDIGLRIFLGIDQQGAVLSDDDNISYIMSIYDKMWDPRLDDGLLKQIARQGMVTSLATINFMNCKNVEVIDHEPSRQQRRWAERTGHKVPMTYKTLVIHPIGKRRLRTPGQATDAQLSLHICRGHFKDYRQGTGLGKWHRHGIWWWSPTVRGHEEVGRVVKDYEVISEEQHTT